MSKKGQIKIHLKEIRNITAPGGYWSYRQIVSTVQEELDTIKGLLGPETHSNLDAAERHIETLKKDLDAVTRSNEYFREKFAQEGEPKDLGSSVLRLTDLCNELGRENAILRNDLTDMTLNYNAAEKHARHLEEEVVGLEAELDLALTSNAWLRERLTFKDESLRACRAAEGVLKEQLKRKEACLARNLSTLQRAKEVLEHSGL